MITCLYCRGTYHGRACPGCGATLAIPEIPEVATFPAMYLTYTYLPGRDDERIDITTHSS